MAEDDASEIERLVRWIAGDFEYGEEVALDRDPDAMRRLRDIATDAHRRWDADRNVEIKIALDNVRIGGETYDYEIELDGDDLDGIFDGTDEPTDVEALRKERAKTEEEHDRERAAAREREIARDRKVSRENNRAFFKVVGFSAAIVSSMVALAIFEKHEHKEKNDEKKEAANVKTGHAGDKLTGQQNAMPTSDPIVEAAADPSGAVVSSCTCSTARDRFTLMASDTSSGQWYVIRSSLLFPINAGGSGLPPASKSALRAAMGCDEDVVALVSGNVAVAWSMTGSGAPQWTRKLPSPIANAPQSMGCSGVLPVRDGRMTVTLVNGQHVSLSMRDGS
jgi:hypothetical protein